MVEAGKGPVPIQFRDQKLRNIIEEYKSPKGYNAGKYDYMDENKYGIFLEAGTGDLVTSISRQKRSRKRGLVHILSAKFSQQISLTYYWSCRYPEWTRP
jgi:hypothetical protein